MLTVRANRRTVLRSIRSEREISLGDPPPVRSCVVLADVNDNGLRLVPVGIRGDQVVKVVACEVRQLGWPAQERGDHMCGARATRSGSACPWLAQRTRKLVLRDQVTVRVDHVGAVVQRAQQFTHVRGERSV